MTDYELMYNTVKLYLKKDGKDSGTATGFFFEDKSRKLIITNKHVLDDIDELTFVFHQSFDAPGRVRKFSIGGSDIERIIHVHKLFDLGSIDITDFITQEDKYTVLTSDDIIEDKELNYDNIMQNVYIVGYPIGIEDELNKLPTFSTGITSSSLLIDYNGNPEVLLNAFALPGSSGSPVFININEKKRLVGIISSGKVLADGKLVGNLCIAVKSQVIKDII